VSIPAEIHWRWRFLVLLVMLSALCGCGHQSPTATGPAQPVSVAFENWPVDGVPGMRVSTQHYLIYSTLPDQPLLGRLAQVMEGALAEYRLVSDDLPITNHPMECWMFETRDQWAAFTRTHTGDDAPVYLRVNRGGYTIGDWYVAYWIGDTGMFSVAAHEGWHQYVARHLKGRLPPFLEEGLACLFEQVEWEGDLPRWSLSANESRLVSLRTAVDGKHLYPLTQLVRMHAGQVVGQPGVQIEAFYAESWAFARFLYDGDSGAHRSALHEMIKDAARGSLFAETPHPQSEGPVWAPSSAKPMLEHYLHMSFPAVDEAFGRYLDRLAEPSQSAVPG
jgi:hypothetical protein